MTNTLTRRAVLSAAPAAVAAAALPAAAETPDEKALRLFRDASPERQWRALTQLDPEETPIMRLFRENRALIDAVEAVGSSAADEIEADRLINEAWEIERRMMALPCQTPADFAAKLIVDSCEGGSSSPWETGEIWKEARQLAGMAEPGGRPAQSVTSKD